MYPLGLFLMASGMCLLFFALHHFGLMVVKGGTFYWGNAFGTSTRFWGGYKHMCGYVSKDFRITPKYSTLCIQIEPVSGSAGLRVSGQDGSVMYERSAVLPMEMQIDCRGMKRCKVRISSQNFEGKFLIYLQ